MSHGLWRKGEKKVTSAASFLITSASNTLSLLMPGTLTGKNIYSHGLGNGKQLLCSGFPFAFWNIRILSLLFFSASFPTKEIEKNLNFNSLWLSSDLFFLPAKMNSWKIAENNVKENEHLLLKVLLTHQDLGLVWQRWPGTEADETYLSWLSMEQGLFPRKWGRKWVLHGKQLKDLCCVPTKREHAPKTRRAIDKSVFMPNNASTNTQVLLATMKLRCC